MKFSQQQNVFQGHFRVKLPGLSWYLNRNQSPRYRQSRTSCNVIYSKSQYKTFKNYLLSYGNCLVRHPKLQSRIWNKFFRHHRLLAFCLFSGSIVRPQLEYEWLLEYGAIKSLKMISFRKKINYKYLTKVTIIYFVFTLLWTPIGARTSSLVIGTPSSWKSFWNVKTGAKTPESTTVPVNK